MEFKTQFDKSEPQYEKLDGEEITEQVGYIPPHKQIEQMILAGERLDASRKEQFDDVDDDYDVDDIPVDPTRRRNYDFFDASDDLRKTEERLKQAEADFKKNSQQNNSNNQKQEIPPVTDPNSKN